MNAKAAPMALERLDTTEAIAPQIFRLLRGQIVRAELLPGEPISETEVAARFSTSRQPVREAFIKLREVDLVEIRPQRGTFVRRISPQAVRDARFVREAIEIRIVEEVAPAADERLIRELRSQLETQRSAVDSDAAAFLKLDEMFHRTLAEAARNLYAWRVIESVKAQMDRVRYLSVAPLHNRILIEQHQAVVDAIERRDAAEGAAAMRAHLQQILISLPELAAARPELVEPDPSNVNDTGGLT